jgi:NADP-dependent aldehyde dehydrogenase
MGSINPVFVLGEALAQRAEDIATGLHGSVTLGVGQFCTNPGLVLVQTGDAARSFLAKLGQLMNATPPGTMLTAGLCAAYRSGVKKFSQLAGVRCLVQAAADAGPGQAQAGAALFATDATTFLGNHDLMAEVFGPATLVVECADAAQMLAVAERLEGQLTATLHATPEELQQNSALVAAVVSKAGRVVFNGFPTGVEVAHAMTHGGPYPATSDGRSTSVGTRAIERFLRPVSFQNFPAAALPPELQEENPLRLPRLVDGVVQLG